MTMVTVATVLVMVSCLREVITGMARVMLGLRPASVVLAMSTSLVVAPPSPAMLLLSISTVMLQTFRPAA